MIPIPPQYAILAKIAALAALLLAATWGGHWITAQRYERAIAEQKAQAERTLTAETEKRRKIEQEYAQHARNTDAVYQTLLADAYAGRDDFAERLRNARRGPSGGCSVPGQTAAAGIAAPVTARGDDGPGEADPALALRDAVVRLQAFARACHGWAVEVGR